MWKVTPGMREEVVGTQMSAEGLMRTKVIELVLEEVEGALLSGEISFGGSGGCLLECSVHPFVSGILLRTTGVDTFRSDAEL